MSLLKTLQNPLKVLSVVLFSLVLLSPSFATVKTQALATQSGVGINPTDYDAKEKFSKGWFIDRLNPGDTVEKSVTLSNYSDAEKRVILSPEDYVQGGQGAYDFSDKQDLKGVGSWITLTQNDITVPGQKAIAVKFTIKVPTDIKPGEYSGVLAIQEAPKGGAGSGFNVVSRVGARIYITVPGDLQAGFQFDNFKFITPVASYTDPTFYKDFLDSNYNNPEDTLFMTMKFRNIGNVFTKLKGSVEVIAPDGSPFKANFDRDYAAFDPFIQVPYFAIPKAKWTVGKWKAKFTFENPGLITSNKSELRSISPTQVVEAEFDMTEEQLNQYKADFKKAKENKDLPKVASSASSSSSNGDNGLQITNAVSSSSSSSAKTEDKNNNLPFYIGGGVIIVLLAVIAFLVFKDISKKKDESKEEVKTTTDVNTTVTEDKTVKTKTPKTPKK